MTIDWRSAARGAIRAGASGAVAAIALAAAGPALAQNTGCGDVQGFLVQRKAISDTISNAAKGKKQIDAGVACRNFGQLVANGQSLIKWVTTNKDWCQIPDSFVEGIKADHGRAVSIRGRACSVAAKQVEMEKQARSGGGGGLLGGNGLSGEMRLPQGAL